MLRGRAARAARRRVRGVVGVCGVAVPASLSTASGNRRRATKSAMTSGNSCMTSTSRPSRCGIKPLGNAGYSVVYGITDESWY